MNKKIIYKILFIFLFSLIIYFMPVQGAYAFTADELQAEIDEAYKQVENGKYKVIVKQGDIQIEKVFDGKRVEHANVETSLIDLTDVEILNYEPFQIFVYYKLMGSPELDFDYEGMKGVDGMFGPYTVSRGYVTGGTKTNANWCLININYIQRHNGTSEHNVFISKSGDMNYSRRIGIYIKTAEMKLPKLYEKLPKPDLSIDIYQTNYEYDYLNKGNFTSDYFLTKLKEDRKYGTDKWDWFIHIESNDELSVVKKDGKEWYIKEDDGIKYEYLDIVSKPKNPLSFYDWDCFTFIKYGREPGWICVHSKEFFDTKKDEDGDGKPDMEGEPDPEKVFEEKHSYIVAAVEATVLDIDRNNGIFADVLEDIVSGTGIYKPGDIDNPTAIKVAEKFDKVLTVVINIGMVATLLILGILGIKYMLGSVEEKAEYKKDLIPYMIGVALMFGILSFVKIFMQWGQSISNL